MVSCPHTGLGTIKRKEEIASSGPVGKWIPQIPSVLDSSGLEVLVRRKGVLPPGGTARGSLSIEVQLPRVFPGSLCLETVGQGKGLKVTSHQWEGGLLLPRAAGENLLTIRVTYGGMSAPLANTYSRHAQQA